MLRIIFALLFVAIGLGLGGIGVYRTMNPDKSISWPNTFGKILESKILERPKATQTNARRGIWKDSVTASKTHQYEFTLDLTYEYKVEGKTYRGGRISPNLATSSSDRDSVVVKQKQYFPSKAVTVHYNPADPNQAYLEYHPPSVWLWYVLGAVFGILAPLLVLFGKAGEPSHSSSSPLFSFQL